MLPLLFTALIYVYINFTHKLHLVTKDSISLHIPLAAAHFSQVNIHLELTNKIIAYGKAFSKWVDNLLSHLGSGLYEMKIWNNQRCENAAFINL